MLLRPMPGTWRAAVWPRLSRRTSLPNRRWSPRSIAGAAKTEPA